VQVLQEGGAFVVLYKNLYAELRRRDLTQRDIASTLSVCERTISNKVNGRCPFELDEAFTIRDELFPGLQLDYLFERGVKA
jgi:DNA-binding XRE family transcriptional regulator